MSLLASTLVPAVLLLSGCHPSPCESATPTASAPKTTDKPHVGAAPATDPCSLSDEVSEPVRQVAVAFVEALSHRRGEALQSLVHPDRGFTIQWAKPIEWRGLPGLFLDDTARRGWCDGDARAPATASASSLLATLFWNADARQEPHRLPMPDDRSSILGGLDSEQMDSQIRAIGPWRDTGPERAVCIRRGGLWPFADEVFVDFADHLVVVAAPHQGTWRVVAVVETETGEPCD
ncbi:MAG: hypothetical protein HOW73_04120 [Polyangiaceae bacterium]|nr:hypothetical protein [Polyangiaceae bacterium]